MEILSLYPDLQEKPWGGRKLIEDYGFHTKAKNAGEAWLLSCHPDGPSLVLNDAYHGMTLREVLAKAGREALGAHGANAADFPILIKLIDAADKLSVQVHPDDAYAKADNGENGKTECWYILDAEPGAELLYGFERDVTREEFLQAVEDNRLTEITRRVPVKPGDVVFIPSGTLHAIGAGILLAEVQQNSNATYRIYDYGRPGNDGKPRPLHKEKAADVLRYTRAEGDFLPCGEKMAVAGGARTELVSCPLFRTSLLEIDGRMADAADETSFVSLLVLSGEGTLTAPGQSLRLKKGGSVFVPAGTGDYTLEGDLRVLRTVI